MRALKPSRFIGLSLSLAIIGLTACTLTACGRDAVTQPKSAATPTATLSVAGAWRFQLDPEDKGIDEGWFNNSALRDEIQLPGTTDEAGFGERTTGPDYGVLSRVHKYIGPAWYQRRIEIPRSWQNKEITLFLERVIWESRVWVDGRELSTQDSLATPHVHKLGRLAPGEHNLVVRIDNDLIHNIGDKGHAYTEYLQTVWNGAVGRLELQARDATHLTSLRLFADIDADTLRLEMRASADGQAQVQVRVRAPDGALAIDEKRAVSFDNGVAEATLDAARLEPWSEFNPTTYQVEVQLRAGDDEDVITASYGHRQVAHNGRHVLINNKPVFLRGNLDCVHFPLTGYPATSVADWKRIFNIYKQYGLNHVRFHSWSPPRAAFQAADEVGIYIQAEASVWLDWWMAVDNEGRPEMNTRGRPRGLGPDNDSGSQFVRAEIERVIDTYGNHPSFVLFAIGNELGHSDFAVLGEWIRAAKAKDPRRLYAASTARTVTPHDDYAATHHYPGIGAVRQTLTNGTDWDYEDRYSQAPIPVIAHEIGQWPVYPEWREIDKYTGVLRARNLEQLRETARDNGILAQDTALRRASGALSLSLYKDEIESFLRTPSAAGMQLLSMQDYSGQGEALIGWLDSFYDSKGLITPQAFRRFNNSTVPLLRLPRYVWTDAENLTARVQVHHFGARRLPDQAVDWALRAADGAIVRRGRLGRVDLETGSLTAIGALDIPLHDLPTAATYRIEISLPGTGYSNDWPIWLYGAEQTPLDSGDIVLAERFDRSVQEALRAGQRVLLLAHRSGPPENVRYAAWRPLYWSASFFPGQNAQTIGLLLRNEHPALAHFPTASHSDWQWWRIAEGARGFVLNDLPTAYRPIAQPVSDFHYNDKLGTLFEVAVGRGKLLVSGYDLSAERMALPEVRQLRHSLLRYMQSAAFKPSQQVDMAWLEALLPFYDTAPAEVPPGFEKAIFYVQAAADTDGQPWAAGRDQVRISRDVDYRVEAEVAQGAQGGAWIGQDIEIELQVPQGIRAEFYLRLLGTEDADGKGGGGGRGGVQFEGRDYLIEPWQGAQKWLKLPVMREDSNDGTLIFKARSVGEPGRFGVPDLRIASMALVPAD